MSEVSAEGSTQNSLQHAFESLDRASEASGDKSARRSRGVGRLVRLPFDGASSASFGWRAQPRQHTTDGQPSAGRRPLAGGITVEEMRQKVQDRLQSKRQRQQEALPQETALACSVEPQEVTPADPPTVEHAAQPTLDQHIEQSGIQMQGSIPRKRTLQWAAKRDRRIARRRRSPPRTRSRAANKEDVERGQHKDSVSIDGSRRLADSSANANADAVDHTATTDPSTGSGSLISTPEEQIVFDGVRTDHDTRNRPMIALSFTEPAVDRISHPQAYSIETQPSSDTEPETEDEERSSEILESSDVRRETRVASQVEDDSQTEDDDEPAPTVARPRVALPKPQQQKEKPKIPVRLPPPGRDPNEDVARQTKPTRPPRLASTVVRAPKRTDRSTQGRLANKEARGRPIFEGFVFAMTGFWSKVKLHAKLVEKHGGKLVKAGAPSTSDNPFDGITHFVICPHGTFVPDRQRVESALKQWCAGRQDAVPLFRKQTQSICLIDVRWISDCIENCLSKHDILPVDRYLIEI